jgi:sugar (pentulose or hexulose) kinase
LAAVAIGLVSGPEAIRDWQGAGTVATPNVETAPTYQSLHEVYTNLYRASKEEMHRLRDLGY